MKTAIETKATHTPGPWEYNQTSLSIVPLLISVEEAQALQVFPSANKDWIICYVPNDVQKKIQEANARLIAAAPDLLKACKLAGITLDDRKKNRRIVAIIKAAIAQAESSP